MKLKFKLLTSLFLIFNNCGVCSYPTISCSLKDRGWKKYIFDRTFSLIGVDNKYVSWGTCWVVSDATPNNFTDYNYYIATNWHVKLGIDNLDSINHKVYYGCKGGSLNYNNINVDYFEFSSYKDENEENFYYDEQILPKSAIDFYIIKANFYNSKMPIDIKQKLDNLNSLQANYGYINQFAKISNKNNYLNKQMYCAGYPVKNNSAVWKAQIIYPNELNYYQYKYAPHGIDSNDTLIDNSPQYIFKNWILNNDKIWHLSGGASGTMLIFKDKNDFKIVGIYWGGWASDEHETYFLPSFSIFNHEKKSFIDKYI